MLLYCTLRERTLWRIIDLYVRGGHLGGHLGFWKSHAGCERPPGLNFIETLRSIEQSKETIVKGPNKVMVPATGLEAELQKWNSRMTTRCSPWTRGPTTWRNDERASLSLDSLPSNASTTIYPNNTAAMYVTKLPTPIELEGEWVASLKKISTPVSFVNIQYNYAEFDVRHKGAKYR